jgi:hypothetical protein
MLLNDVCLRVVIRGRRRGSHPVVGGVIHSSRRAVFGRWVTILAVIARRCCLVCVTQGWHLIGLRGLLSPRSPRSLRGQCGVPTLVRAGVSGRIRSLPVPPRGRGGGEVVRRSSAFDEGRGKRSWPTPALVLGPGPHGLAGPRSFGLIPAHVPWAALAAD